MNFLFDNCTSHVLASTLDGFIRRDGHRACHLKDLEGLPGGRHSKDSEWLAYLKSQAEPWIFLTADDRIRRNKPERMALRSSGLHGFVLARGYAKLPLNQQASLLLWHWPSMLQVVLVVKPPALHELPVNRGSRLPALPF